MSWIKLHREMLDWGWYLDVPVKVLWIHILLKANYVEKEWMGEPIPMGSLVTSTDKLSNETGLTTQQVRTALKKLKLTNEISVKTTNKFTVISINKWDEYQADNDPCNNRETNEQQSGNKRATTSIEIKKERNKEIKNNIRPSIEEVEAYCSERGNRVDPQKWFDYYSSNGWKVGKNPMKDWKACVRTWERNTNVSTTPRRNESDTLPTYSTDRNKSLSNEDEQELLKLMGRSA